MSKEIWNYLYNWLGNEYGTAGLMGNLYAESALISTNLQNTFNSKLGLTDEQYTSKVDSGNYTNFVYDSAGYGLAQWTFWSRKKALLEYAKSKGTSIGDLYMQLDFLKKELSENHPSLVKELKNAKSVFEASTSVLTKFEQPRDQGTTVQNTRASYGNTYYEKYRKKVEEVATYSKLAKYVFLGKNYYGTRNAVLGIIPHVIVGRMSLQEAYNYFHGTNNASANYIIDWFGNIWCIIPEEFAAWTTSNMTVDKNHITVEIASDPTHPYAISNAAYESLIKLTADIYKHYGLKECKWTSSKAYDALPGGVPMHRNYKNKACPGDYIVGKYKSGDFCKRVNALLKGEVPMDEKPIQKETNPKNNFGIKYRAHVQSIGDCKEVHDGQVAGTVGFGKRLEELRITCPEGVKVSAKAHIQRKGWIKYPALQMLTIGTRGEALRLEALELEFEGIPEGKTVRYQAHIQGLGWTDAATNGFPIGSMSQSKRIEAIKIWYE